MKYVEVDYNSVSSHDITETNLNVSATFQQAVIVEHNNIRNMFSQKQLDHYPVLSTIPEEKYKDTFTTLNTIEEILNKTKSMQDLI